jgi:hypothetical protein
MLNKKDPSQPVHRFAFYHQNEALLFQFLVHECLQAHHLLRKKPCPVLLSLIVGNLQIDPEKWQAPTGHLPRLMHYCILLISHFNQPTSRYCLDLQGCLNRAYLAAKKYEESSDQEKGCEKLYKLLKKEISCFAKTLLEKLPDFRENASVLYFLLRYQEQVDAIYRQPFIKKTFHLFFPEGLDAAILFMTEKFAKKGFHLLIPSIEEKLKFLSNDEKSKD